MKLEDLPLPETLRRDPPSQQQLRALIQRELDVDSRPHEFDV